MADIVRCKKCGKQRPTDITTCPYCNHSKMGTGDGMSTMRMLGIILIVGGGLWCMWAFNMNIAVDTAIGKINNLGLMDDRRNMITISGLVILVGALFIAFGGKSPTTAK